MASAYPGALDALVTTRQDDTDSKSGADLGLTTTTGVHAQDHNDLADAVNKIEAELGINPSGTFADVLTRLAARTTVRKSADQTFSSTTVANVTDLSFAIASGQDYWFKFWVPFTAAALTTGLGLALTCPALTGYIAAQVTIPRLLDTAGTAPASSSVYGGQITSSGDTVVADATPIIAPAVQIAVVEGILSNPSAAGTLQLQAKTEVNASNVIVKKGAYGELYLN